MFSATLFFSSCTSNTKKEQKKTKTETDIDSLLNINPNDVNLLAKRSNKSFAKFLKTANIEDLYKSKQDAAKAFRLDSNNYEARMAYAEALSRTPNLTSQELNNVYRHYNWLLSKKKTAKAYVGLASYYSFIQNPEKGIELTDKALRIDKKYRDAYIMKARLFLQLQKPDLAISSYETAVQQDNSFLAAYMKLGQLYTEQEKYPIALERFRNVTLLNSQLPEAWYGVAMSHQMMNENKQALDNYRQLMRVDPTFYLGYFNMGWVKQYRENQIDSALFFYSKSLDITPDFVKAHHNIGLCYEEKKDISRALVSYGKALKYNPNYELSKQRVKELKKHVYEK